jgi:DNA-binding MarR family transcriptional regulator
MIDPHDAYIERGRRQRLAWRVIAGVVPATIKEQSYLMLAEIVREMPIKALGGARPATNVSHLIETLRRAGLIQVNPSQKDKRRKMVKRTDAGNGLVESVRAALSKEFAGSDDHGSHWELLPAAE